MTLGLRPGKETEEGRETGTGITERLAEAHARVTSRRAFTASPRRRLDRLERRLAEAAERLPRDAAPTSRARAAEWLLDNAYLVSESLERVREGLPRGFYRRLPRLAATGEIRVRTLAAHLVARGEGYVEPAGLVPVLTAYQRVTPLTIGELWALPSMLRWVLLDALVEACAVLEEVAEEEAGSFGVADEAAEGVAACVRSLRSLDAHDWKRFFESVSLVEKVLRRDPAGVYGRSTFPTRDRCRKAVEDVARCSALDEVTVAETAVSLAFAAPPDAVGPRTVCHHLLEPGRRGLEEAVEARIPARMRIRRLLRRMAGPLYFGALAATTAGTLALLLLPFLSTGAWVSVVVGGILGLIPASAVGMALVNWVATRVTRPRPLPKLVIERRVPPELHTMVVVPVLLSDGEEVADVLSTLELNYRGNPLRGLSFALLADFPDADTAVLPGDDAILQEAARGVRDLNTRYGEDGDEGPFLLLYRDRLWNESQGCWMGWERKRGKLHEFNRMVLSGEGGLRVLVGRRERVREVRYALTLDADTFLPQKAAARLIGTAGHPLNRPVFGPSGRVVSGYTVLQPRVETTPRSAGASLFSRLFEGEEGLDLYSHAVSDVYQDLFGAGIYAGKGIYDVAAFERSLEGRAPENAILSHDLFEGAHGRAGLVSDVVVFEDYPAHVFTFFHRLHRWVRGDWQILPWILPVVPVETGGWARNVLPGLERWKIADNLRRSLLMPSVLLLLLAGWTVLAPPVWWWTAAALGPPAAPLLLEALGGAAARFHRRSRWVSLTASSRSLARGLGRWVVAVILLPSRALVEADAVGRTLARLVVTRRNLLEWTSAASAARRFDASDPRSAWVAMAPGTMVAVVFGGVLALVRPEALVAGVPLLALWAASPAVAQWLSRPGRRPDQSLSPDDVRRLRALAHRTWGFFERFMSPQYQWLPPDHAQERPHTAVALRSSPTNMGLGVLAVLAAWDLGYLSTSRLAATLANVMERLEELERHRGHLYNWYDTGRGTVLPPRFVSTVDSGNLAASLIALARGCERVPERPFPDPALEGRGVLDALEVVRESADRLGARAGDDPGLEAFHQALDRLAARVEEGMVRPDAWAGTVSTLLDDDVPALENAAVSLVEFVTRTGRVAAGTELRTSLQRLRRQVGGLRSEMDALAPWLLPDPSPPEWRRLAPHLDAPIALRDLPEALERALAEAEVEGGVVPALRSAVEEASRNAATATLELELLARRADALVEEMDFSFLYDRLRKIFHVGYDVDAARLVSSHYDLLASEARLASFVAIAKGDVSQEHWLHLGRPYSRAGGQGVLLSWSGTLFEYLMPELILRTPEPSLMDFADRAAVDRQMSFAARRGIPWGTSESAYHHLDHQGTYQYRAFGTPELAIRRDAADRLVVAPYASVLALRAVPRAVVENLKHIEALEGLGQFGLYEALDFAGEDGRAGRPNVVRSWMTHHQAMILLSLTNHLADDVMVERFHSDRRVQAAELLLHERVPGRVPARATPIRSRASDRRSPAPLPVREWVVEPGPLPRAHVLSNGQWSTLLTDRGGGGARWKGHQLTRWRADPASCDHGVWLYVQDLESGSLWSAVSSPTGRGAQDEEVSFAPHKAAFRRSVAGVTSRLTVFVAPTAPVEVRALRLTNESDRPRKLAVTSYGEVVLAPHAQDRRHPAFTKLFVESAFRPEASTLVFRRRPGTRGVEPLHLAHSVVGGPGTRVVGWETDRARFLGRPGEASSPSALAKGPAGLAGSEGATLDPIFALGAEVELPPFGQAVVVFLTSVGPTEEEALASMERLRSLDRIDWALEQVADRARLELHGAGIHPDEAPRLQALLTGLAFPYHGLRGRSIRHRMARPRQPELWAHGVSGDVPVLLLRVADADHVSVAEEVMRLHALLLRRRVVADLVILDETAGDYADPVRAWLQGAVARHHGAEWMDRTGGVHYVAAGRLDEESRDALEGVAGVFLDTAGGDLGEKLRRLDARVERLPAFVPVPGPRSEESDLPPLPPLPDDLLFFNGIGGFTPDGREYVLRVTPSEGTPAPWINVVANPRFGFTLSERGGGFTWSGNSGEHRLTPWSNDPVADRPGEVVYLRDEETAEVWSPTPGPALADAPYEVRHGAGYSAFAHHSHGLAQHLELFVDPEAPVKIVRLTVRNLLRRPRRITATSYVEWVLGNHRDVAAPHVVTELVAPDAAVLAREIFGPDESSRVAFHAASRPLHGATGDRVEFLSGPGGLAYPAGLERVGLGEAFGAALDPCAALQVHLDLASGEEQTVHFVLGEGGSREEALELIRRYRTPEAAEEARTATDRFWDDFLGRVQVRTPEPALDVLLNRWLPYQAMACRLWGRSALYQSSGAYGFRDQLQDTLSLLHRDPATARDHILEAAAHQFTEGDVLHWWHPTAEAGVRTRCSDDLLWLPWVTAEYVEATGDRAILDEPVPFLEAPTLHEEERERYERFSRAPEPASLYEHCMRALRRGATRGAHGLPLMGTGDWNDGMDRVGEGGSGESVWLGWFLHACLDAFAPLAEGRGDDEGLAFLAEEAERLREAVEAEGWDGAWYRRAYYDDGSPLGSADGDECRIDSLTQSWAVLSGAARPERARRALASVLEELVKEEDRLVLLLAPPFDTTPREPGYIKAYPPGVRENGGQYTHAAIWAAWAFTALGDGATAGHLLRLLNPVLRTRTPEGVERYRVEPYVVAADVYGVEPHTGRGGWTWYTGSSGWMYRLGVEAVLGVRPSGGGFRVDPCIPPEWESFEATLRRDDAEYRIWVENPDGVSRGVREITVDGRPADDGPIELRPGHHEVRVRLGEAGDAPVPGPG